MTSHKKYMDKALNDPFEELYPSDNFYDEDEIELLLEDDEISDEEEAFMAGYIDEME